MTTTETSDILWGAKNIAEYLGLKKRQVYHMIQNRQIIVGRKNNKLCISREDLREQFRLAALPQETLKRRPKKSDGD